MSPFRVRTHNNRRHFSQPVWRLDDRYARLFHAPGGHPPSLVLLKAIDESLSSGFESVMKLPAWDGAGRAKGIAAFRENYEKRGLLELAKAEGFRDGIRHDRMEIALQEKGPELQSLIDYARVHNRAAAVLGLAPTRLTKPENDKKTEALQYTLKVWQAAPAGARKALESEQELRRFVENPTKWLADYKSGNPVIADREKQEPVEDVSPP